MMARVKRRDVGATLEAVSTASAKISVARTTAKIETIELLRGFERAVQEALVGDKLRGMKSLLPSECVSFQAAAIGTGKHGINTFLPMDGRPMLVWTKRGELHVATRRGRSAESRPIRDDELMAQDLDPVMRALDEVLLRHLEHAEESLRSYRAVLDLASRLSGALML